MIDAILFNNIFNLYVVFWSCAVFFFHSYEFLFAFIDRFFFLEINGVSIIKFPEIFNKKEIHKMSKCFFLISPKNNNTYKKKIL